MSTNNYDDMPQRPEDPRDAVVRQLRAEVERLAGLLDAAGDRLAGDLYRGEWNEAAKARALLSRLEAAHA